MNVAAAPDERKKIAPEMICFSPCVTTRELTEVKRTNLGFEPPLPNHVDLLFG